MLAAVAEHETATISLRTKAGLAAAKAKGVVLGKSMDTAKATKGRTTQAEVADRNAAKVRATIISHRVGGATLQGIADELNSMGVGTPRGKRWTAMAVSNAMNRG